MTDHTQNIKEAAEKYSDDPKHYMPGYKPMGHTAVAFTHGAEFGLSLACEEIEKLKTALGWKKIDRKEYPKNYDIMKYSQPFMEELVAMQDEEIKRLLETKGEK